MREERSGRAGRRGSADVEAFQPDGGRHRHLKLTWLAALLALAAPTAFAAELACPKAVLPPIALPHLARALARGDEIVIVALGSSSTEGVRASDRAHAYPAVLQSELERALPKAHVAVLNRGVGGQDAAEEVLRLNRDVLAAGPSLVIWQVGANGAMRGSDPRVFTELVSRGVKHLVAANVDVLMMDNQRSPQILASPDHAKFDQAVADIAAREKATLFARGRLMEEWQEEGHPYAEFIDADGVHHNDHGYSCIARALASSIVRGLGPDTRTLQAAQ